MGSYTRSYCHKLSTTKFFVVLIFECVVTGFVTQLLFWPHYFLTMLSVFRKTLFVKKTKKQVCCFGVVVVTGLITGLVTSQPTVLCFVIRQVVKTRFCCFELFGKHFFVKNKFVVLS